MALVKAVYKDQVIAESESTLIVEGNYYFPEKDVKFDHLKNSETSTHCPWKGDANYYSVEIEGTTLKDACWYYLTPSHEARRLKGHYAFWGEIKIIKETSEEMLGQVCSSTVSFIKGVVNNTKGAEKRCPGVANEFKKFLGDVGSDALTMNLPSDYINTLGFFNFYNSTNACFLTDYQNKITKTNPTFNWAFDEFDVSEMSLECFLNGLEVEKEYVETVFETLKSHGWVKIPQIRVKKNGAFSFYSLDIAIAKHGDLDSLTGLQGQFIDVTKEVELSRSVEDLLNNAGEGFLSFCSNFLIQEKYSQVCESFFDGQIAGKSILDLILRDAESKAKLKDTLDVIFGGTADLDMMIEVLPKEIHVNERWLGIDYRWIPHSEYNAVDRMMLILTDITKEKELEETVRKDKLLQESILKIVTDKDGYLDMQDELTTVWEDISSILGQKELTLKSVNDLFRAYHTIKGGSAVYSLTDIVELAHTIENDLSMAREGEVDFERLRPTWVTESEQLKEIYEKTILKFNQILGIERTESRMLSVSEEKVDLLLSELKSKLPESFAAEIDGLGSSFKKQPIGGIFQKYKNSSLDLAKQLEKEVEVEIVGEEIEVDKKRYESVFGNIIHLIRNSVDHGLENSFERMESGKPEVGNLKIICQDEADSLILKIEDDGKGIDPIRMKSIAKQKELMPEEQVESLSDQEAIELIFHPGFSSKEEVSDVSGRGVGMDAVKSAVNELSGDIEVTSKVGEGTKFLIKLPKAA